MLSLHPELMNLYIKFLMSLDDIDLNDTEGFLEKQAHSKIDKDYISSLHFEIKKNPAKRYLDTFYKGDGYHICIEYK